MPQISRVSRVARCFFCTSSFEWRQPGRLIIDDVPWVNVPMSENHRSNKSDLGYDRRCSRSRKPRALQRPRHWGFNQQWGYNGKDIPVWILYNCIIHVLYHNYHILSIYDIYGGRARPRGPGGSMKYQSVYLNVVTVYIYIGPIYIKTISDRVSIGLCSNGTIWIKTGAYLMGI